MSDYRTEDQVRDEAKSKLGFDDNEQNVKQGTGQITTFNQLGYKGVIDKPDGWYFSDDKNIPAIVLETKPESEEISKQKWADELFKNIDIVKIICKELDKPESLITHVTDRKGHDMRYAIDPTKIHNELGWLPETKFEDGIKKTIQWYLDNREWWETIISGEYQNYYEKMYGNR